MNITLFAVKLAASSAPNKYGLIIAPPLQPDVTGLDPNDIADHAYETLEQLWQVLKTCELVSVPDIATLRKQLEKASKPIAVAQLSLETAQRLGFK